MLVFPQFGLAAGLAGLMGVGTSQVPADGFLNNLHWTLAHTAVSNPDEAQDPAPSASFSGHGQSQHPGCMAALL